MLRAVADTHAVIWYIFNVCSVRAIGYNNLKTTIESS